MTELIGIFAAFLTTVSFLPQTLKTIKSRDTRGISLIMYILFSLGVFLWLIYGILLQNYIIAVANSITLSLCGIILTIKVKNCKRK